jgi:hypothetical protein
MRAKASRLIRSSAVLALSAYCLLLLTAALPSRLIGARLLQQAQLGAGYALHSLGITPGLGVFDGKESLHAVHQMTCFRVIGEGRSEVVLYDDLALCRERRIEAVRDPWRVLQMRQLSAAFVELNLSGRGDLRRPLLQPLFLFSDYYCHQPAAEQASVERVTFEALYVGLNTRDGTTGEVPMRGSRDCKKPTWVVGR